ncbi:antitoxin ParD1/3/4 [Rhizobium sp. NFR07]|uniref:type II toxin-antitoxin system ParD family antitoxin n=1 Tax=Rhizobium sp. NFR07 TaxID=1566262 RepID=UPI0008E70ACD|nr:type II toxin-antitoxin system ParD family antitoxin [Rhizobium sp. NFR07]SFB02791.1 antitoxin ParD1/3/4 [Rhizobium sp. NFR07]
MLNVALGKEDEEFVRKQLETGRYGDAADVVRAGLRLLEDEKAFDRWIDEELPARYDEYLKDPSRVVPAEEVHARFEARRKSNAIKAE